MEGAVAFQAFVESIPSRLDYSGEINPTESKTSAPENSPKKGKEKNRKGREGGNVPQELLNVKLERTRRVVEVVRLEDRRVQDPNRPNHDVPTRSVRGEDRRNLVLDVLEEGRFRFGGGGPGDGADTGVGAVGRGDGGKGDVGSRDEWGAVPDFGGAVGEVGRVWGKVSPAGLRRNEGREERTLVRLDEVTRISFLRVGNVGDPKSQHEAVDQAVHDFEPGLAPAKDPGDASHVAGLALDGGVLDDDVADLKDPERERVLAVLADGLEHAREEGRADDLVLDRLGVREDDGEVSRVLAVEELEVLVVRALEGVTEKKEKSMGGTHARESETNKDQGKDFDPTSLGTHPADSVAELVWREGLGDGAGRGERALEVVEPVRHRGVLHDVALVQDVGPGRRDEDVDEVVVGDLEVGRVERLELLAGNGDRRVEAHLAEELDDVGAGEGEAGAGVDVGGAGDERARSEFGGEDGAGTPGGASGVDDSDGLDTVWGRALAEWQSGELDGQLA